MRSSFNAYGRSSKEYGPLHIPIWLGHVKPIPVGGTLDQDFNLKGLLLQAGTPINITDKVIKPLIGFEVVSFTAAAGQETDDVIVIKPAQLGEVKFLPEVGDLIQKLGATFAATGKAAAVKSVTPGETAGTYAVAVLHSATIDTPSAGDTIVLSSATSAGSNKAIAVQPNAYLFHDIWLGDLDVENDDTFATGAAIMYHPEGILIDRTPAAPFKAAMAAAVPGVLQVSE